MTVHERQILWLTTSDIKRMQNDKFRFGTLISFLMIDFCSILNVEKTKKFSN